MFYSDAHWPAVKVSSVSRGALANVTVALNLRMIPEGRSRCTASRRLLGGITEDGEKNAFVGIRGGCFPRPQYYQQFYQWIPNLESTICRVF